MSPEYLTERLGALLNTALVYARLRNEGQFQKALAAALKLVDDEGRSSDAVTPVLEEYAAAYASAGRQSESARLRELAAQIRAALPHLYNTDGSAIPWYQQERFTSAAPPLPLTLKPSRAVKTGGGCASAVLAMILGGLVVMVLLGVIVARPLPSPVGEVLFAAWGLAIIAGGIVAHQRQAAESRRNLQESWCRLTETGIEFNSPDELFSFDWNEITSVAERCDAGDREEPYDVVEIWSGNRKFRISARFFTEDEVRLVNGLARLRSGL